MEYKILVVDDEENMQALLKRVLGKAGYRVSCVDGGKRAIQIVSEIHFHLAIVDVSMPGMDGLEVLRRLKLIDKKLPVIMISAFASWEKEQMARHLGCVDYLSKPLSMKHFKNVVCKSIEQATG